jgi:hypothetical protein
MQLFVTTALRARNPPMCLKLLPLLIALPMVHLENTPLAAADEPQLVVTDEAGKVHQITATNISRLARRKLETTDYDKTKAEYEGVSLVDLLQSAGVVFGKELKGTRASTVVLIEANDGYRIAISLLEIDPATTDRLVLLADRRDGKALAEKEGPFRLVIPDDKRQVRWIRMIRAMRVVNLKETPLTEQSPTK